MHAAFRRLIVDRALVKPGVTPRITAVTGTPVSKGVHDWLGLASLYTLSILIKEAQCVPPWLNTNSEGLMAMAEVSKWPDFSARVRSRCSTLG